MDDPKPIGCHGGKIDLEIKLPPGFPEKYREAVIHVAQLCAVKKHLEHPPKFEITTTMS